jgi:hypothetical protein
MTTTGVRTGLRATIQLSIQDETQPDAQLLAELEEIDLRWRAEGMGMRYRPLRAWLELDLLLARLGIGGPDFIVVESLARHRFVQTMGDPGALIIEVCGNAGTLHPDVWRLRRAPGDVLPTASLGVVLFEGGMDAENLFIVEEAGRVFREWLRGGEVSGVVLERVVY